MLITLPNVLNTEELAVINELLSKGKFTDGKFSAGEEAASVKNNQELETNNEIITPLNNLLMGNLVQHPVYLSAAHPYKIAAPYYARYTTGMSYGKHVDDPIMGPPGQRYRSDISITVFLNDPGSYDGGELVIDTTYGEQSIKLKAGDAVMYPSSSTHQVTEITRGERIVAVTWLQSMIRDPVKRELLYNLHLAREELLQADSRSEASKKVSNAYVNLVRMWSEI